MTFIPFNGARARSDVKFYGIMEFALFIVGVADSYGVYASRSRIRISIYTQNIRTLFYVQ